MADESRIRLLRRERVKQLTGLSTTGLYTRMQMHEFPRPVSLGGGGRAVAWIESEVLEWIKGRKAERDAEVAAS
jgi:prophage regulatory protein